MLQRLPALLLLIALCWTGCGVAQVRQAVILSAGFTRVVDQAAAPLYTQAAEAAQHDQVLLQQAKTDPVGALAAYHAKMAPWENLRHAVDLARGAELAAAQTLDALPNGGADKNLSAVTAAAYAVGTAADLVQLLQAAQVPIPSTVASIVSGACSTVGVLLKTLQPSLPAPCATRTTTPTPAVNHGN